MLLTHEVADRTGFVADGKVPSPKLSRVLVVPRWPIL